MICSKFLRHCHTSSHFVNINKSSKRVHQYVLSLTVPSCSSFYLSSSKYSVLHSKSCKLAVEPVAAICIAPSSLYAFMSTNVIDDKYKVIVTNPTEGITYSSLTDVESISKVEEIVPASDIASTLNESLTTVSDVVEPSLASLGLCNWTPVGLIQMLLEYFHISYHMPWWLAIVSGTVLARILLLPLLIKIQKNAVEISNYMPQLQYLQAKFGEARRSGNSLEASRYAAEMMTFMKDKNISPLKNAALPLLQAPVFLSFFFGLRSMARLPVDSLRDGGIWWVTDLTIPDPYYVLPVVACGTLYVVLKVGAESGVRMENMKLAKYVFQALPVILLPFCINFPAAILYYWCTNNFCTLIIVSILKIKPIRKYFNLPIQQPLDPKFQLPKKGFVKGVKDAYEDQKILGIVEERRRFDEIRFQKAGIGPIPRTYSYDPTKPRPSNIASTANRSIAAKEHKT